MAFQAEAESTDSVVLDNPVKDISGEDNCEPPRASLLGVPAEIKNRIWELVLVRRDEIFIEAGKNNQEPGLLRTCRQIRAEASEMFFTQNFFYVHCEIYVLAPHKGHWYWKKAPYENTDGSAQGPWECEILLPWLEIHHAGFDAKFFRVYQDLATDYEDAMSWVSDFFDMAETLRSQPWITAKRLLKFARQLVKNTVTGFASAKSNFLDEWKAFYDSDLWDHIRFSLDEGRERVENAIMADESISTFSQQADSLWHQSWEGAQRLPDQARKLVKDAIRAHEEGWEVVERLECTSD